MALLANNRHKRVLRFKERVGFVVLAITYTALFYGCGGGEGLRLKSWEEFPREHYVIPPYAKHLARFRIALDPGHGGMAHLPDYKRGPTGKREAVMNLSVARYLQEFLERAGAKVVLTRERDEFVSLQQRADTAAAVGCDFLVSLHHNVSSNPRTNYAAVFYHRHPDYSPASMDLARNIYFGLVEALHLPQVAEDGLLTDQLIYPGGFGLLRRLRIPGVLLESSFYSNPSEERRLMEKRYNRREAYGIFLGLARWAAGGVPSAKMLRPAGIAYDKQPEIVYELRDGITDRGGRGAGQLLAFTNSVQLKLDGQPFPAQVDLKVGRLRGRPLQPLANGVHTMQVELQNMFKNHNLPRVDTLIIASPARAISFHAPSDSLPADGTAVMPIEIKLFDEDGQPVWDGTRVTLTTDNGTIGTPENKLKDGSLIAYFQSSNSLLAAKIIARADSLSDTLTVHLVPPGTVATLSGTVSDELSKTAIAGAQIIIADSIRAATDRNGAFFVINPSSHAAMLTVAAKGYASISEHIDFATKRSRLRHLTLTAHLGGMVHGEHILLDASLGGSDTGDLFASGGNAAESNLQLLAGLADSLVWAGALPQLIRTSSDGMTAAERIKQVNAFSEGWYLKFGYRAWQRDSVHVRCTIYPANQVALQIAQAINRTFARHPNTGTSLVQDTSVPEVTLTNKTAIEVRVTCRVPEIFDRDLPLLFDSIVQYYRERRLASHSRERSDE